MTPTNTAASIHQRLLNKAAAENRTFNELLQYYAIERFLSVEKQFSRWSPNTGWRE